jgi:L-arabinose isomerase
MCGIEFLTIGERTRIDEFANEIRWNAAYYFLSGTV